MNDETVESAGLVVSPPSFLSETDPYLLSALVLSKLVFFFLPRLP